MHVVEGAVVALAVLGGVVLVVVAAVGHPVRVARARDGPLSGGSGGGADPSGAMGVFRPAGERHRSADP